MRGVATSTVAMTIYNSLCGCGGGRTLGEIAGLISLWREQSRISVPDAQLAAAVGGLVRRGFVRELPGGIFDVADPQRRVVMARDRSDEGSEDPGWHGWKVHSRPMAAPAMVALEEVVK